MISKVFKIMVLKPMNFTIQPINQINSYKFASFTEKMQKRQS
jgi:hypothetical protein